MLEYQSLSIADFGGGITDDFKDITNGKFSKLDNITIKGNRSGAVRNGTAPLVSASSIGISAIGEIGNTLLALNGKDMTFRHEGGELTDTTVEEAAGSLPYRLKAIPNESRIERWRNMAITTAPDAANTNSPMRTMVLHNMDVRSQMASLPRVTKTNVVEEADGERLFAVCIKRTQIDSDGFTYVDYSPEYVGRAGASVNLGDIEVNGSATGLDNIGLFDDEITVALFVTLGNETTLYLSGESNITLADGKLAYDAWVAGTAYAVDEKVVEANVNYKCTTANSDSTFTPANWLVISNNVIIHNNSHDAGLERNEKGFFLSEEPKMQVPPCRYSTIVNNTGWYLNVVEDGEIKPYRLRQSVQGMPTSLIASAYKDLDYPCNGIGQMNNMPIVLSNECLFRIEGGIGVDGSGSIRSVRVVGSEGGISNRSIVNAGNKMFYAGTDGFYATDGYSAQNISGAALYDTYIKYTGRTSDWKKIIGTYDRDSEVIHWVMPNNDVMVLHLSTMGFTIHRYDVAGTITAIHSTYSKTSRIAAKLALADTGQPDAFDWECDASTVRDLTSDMQVFVGDKPAEILRVNAVTGKVELRFEALTAVADIDGKLVYTRLDDYTRQLMLGLDDSKCMLVSSAGIYSDANAVDGSDADPSLWDETHIHWDILTAGLNYGSPVVKKWVKDVSVSAESEAIAAIAPYVINDGRGELTEMKLITNRDAYIPADVSDIFARESKRFEPKVVIASRRHLPKGRCRCKTNQIGLRSTSAGLYSSYDYCTMEVTAIDMVSRLVTAVVLPVGTELVKIPYGVDSGRISVAQLGQKIDRSMTSIASVADDREEIVFGLGNTVPLEIGDVIDWVITDYPKKQSIEILSLTIKYAMLADIGLGFQASDDIRSEGGS